MAVDDLVETEAPRAIDEYLRKRLMPVEGAIPQLAGIEMHGATMPAEAVGGDVYEYINFQQRYNIEARIARAKRLATEYLQPLAKGAKPQNEVDVHARWIVSQPGFTTADAMEYRRAKSSEQLRIAQSLRELYTTAGVLVVDAQGHGIIAAKIASTVHDTLHAFMLSELDRSGAVTPVLFEELNLRLAHSATARNALGRGLDGGSREIATMLYGEIKPGGQFRFVNFGHPAPLVFSAKYKRFMEIGKARIAQFLALGLEIPDDHPDRNKYISVKLRKGQIKSSDMAEITLMGRGDILFLYTDGVFDGADDSERREMEGLIASHEHEPAKAICDAILEHALNRDEKLRQAGRSDEIDDKTVFIIRRT